MDHTKHSNLCTRGQLWRSSWLSIAVVSPQLYLSMSWTITQATPLFNHYHFATRYRFPWKVFCNEGSQLLKRTKEDIWLNFTDIKSKLNKDHQVIVKTYPVGGHKKLGAKSGKSISHWRSPSRTNNYLYFNGRPSVPKSTMRGSNHGLWIKYQNSWPNPNSSIITKTFKFATLSCSTKLIQSCQNHTHMVSFRTLKLVMTTKFVVSLLSIETKMRRFHMKLADQYETRFWLTQ